MNPFWIKAVVVVVLVAIAAAIDIFNAPQDKKSRTSLLIWYAIILGGSLLAAWGIHSIGQVVKDSIVLAALIFSARYLIRKFANRKL